MVKLTVTLLLISVAWISKSYGSASSCEVIFNGDKYRDTALLVEENNTKNLYVLLASEGDKVEKMLVFEKAENMELKCEHGSVMSKNSSGTWIKKHDTEGGWIILKPMKGSSIAIFMFNNELKKDFIND